MPVFLEEELDQDRLQEILRYEPEIGEFFWLRRSGKGARNDLAGKRAGHLGHKGYLAIEIGSKEYRAHRLAWLYVYGDWPEDQIDHINRIKNDNRIANLRVATNGQNGANSNPKPSYSGLKGAHWHSRDKKWFSHIWHNGKQTSLGRFATAEAAHVAYCEASKNLREEFFHSGQSK